MSVMTTIARPYAKAAFDFAVEKGEMAKWGQMLTFTAEVANNDDMKKLINGAVSAPQLVEIFSSVCEEQLDEFGQNFIKVMAENGRLKALPSVLDLFLTLQAEYEKVIDVEVISAIALSEKQLANIGTKLEARLERKVKLNCSVDETLLGGVVIRAGDLVIDNSARTSIRRLGDALQS